MALGRRPQGPPERDPMRIGSRRAAGISETRRLCPLDAGPPAGRGRQGAGGGERLSSSSPSAAPIPLSRSTPCSSSPLQLATWWLSTRCWPQAATKMPDPTTTTTCPLASSLWSWLIWLGAGLIGSGSSERKAAQLEARGRESWQQRRATRARYAFTYESEHEPGHDNRVCHRSPQAALCPDR